MAIDNWTDEECRYFFYLYLDEKKKGNKTKAGMNQTGKDFIMKKFEERFGKALGWENFKNKYDSSKKSYVKFKKLTHNRTGLLWEDWTCLIIGGRSAYRNGLMLGNTETSRFLLWMCMKRNLVLLPSRWKR